MATNLIVQSRKNRQMDFKLTRNVFTKKEPAYLFS